MAYKKTVKRTPKDSVIEIIQSSRNDKIIRDGKNLTLQRLFEGGFDITPKKGATKITSHMLQQALWKTIARMKPLDFSIHGTGQDEWKEKLVSDAIATVLDKGGYNDAMRCKDGLFQKCLMWGDGWMMIGTNPDRNAETPILFQPISNSNVYFDSFATKMRGAKGAAARKCVIIFSYSWEMAKQLYPKIEKTKDAAPGRVPRDNTNFKELQRTYTQTTEINADDIVEVAHYYDLDKDYYGVLVGPNLATIEEHKGEDYPFEMDGEKYIPVINQMCMPSSAGIYNHGIFDMIYDYALLTAELMNMAIGHAEDSVYPITIVNVPQAEVSKFFNKLRVAHEMRQAGKKGYVAMEQGVVGANQAVANQLTTQSMFQEWQALYETFTREVGRLGINLDEIDRGANVTATQIMAEEESANSLVKQIQEYNASEAKFAVEVTMDFIKKFIKNSNKTPLELTTNYIVEGVPIKGNIYTLGDVADDLRKNEYFVKINVRSGATPSNIMQQTQISRILQLTPPGSKAWLRLAERYARLNDQDIQEEDFGMGQQAELGGPAPAETERQSISPRFSEPLPAL